jgi:DNA replication protein DnaC
MTDEPEITLIYKPATCNYCREPFTAAWCPHPFRPGELWIGQKACPRCLAEYQDSQRRGTAAAEEKIAKARHEARWAELCPVEFKTVEEGGETDPNRLRLEQPRFADALSWRFGKTGLLLIGPSGSCKTRVAWRIVRREFEAGRRVMAMKAHGFGIECVDRRTSRGGFTDWYRQLVRVPLLFIDDLGKGRFTDDVESHFFGLIDERTENGRPLIITSNSTGNALKERMSADRGEPIIRRLRDYCQTIVFER